MGAIAGSMREAKKQRGYEAYRLLAAGVTFRTHVAFLLSPASLHPANLDVNENDLGRKKFRKIPNSNWCTRFSGSVMKMSSNYDVSTVEHLLGNSSGERLWRLWPDRLSRACQGRVPSRSPSSCARRCGGG